MSFIRLLQESPDLAGSPALPNAVLVTGEKLQDGAEYRQLEWATFEELREKIGAEAHGAAAEILQNLQISLAPGRVIISNAHGKLDTTSVTASELGALAGVVGSIPMALDSKASLTHEHHISEILDLQPALDGKADLVAGRVPSAQLPALVKTDVFTVSSESEMLALVAESGDLAIRLDVTKTYVHNGGSTGTADDWSELISPTDAVTNVNGLIGSVNLGYADVGACSSTDARLSDARTPQAHALSHSVSGSDPLTLAQSQISGLSVALASKSETTHTHTQYMQTAGGIFSGNISVRNASTSGVNLPAVYLSNVANPEIYAALKHLSSSRLGVEKTSSGQSVIEISPIPLDGVSESLVRFFRDVSTTGPSQVQILRGDGTATVNHAFSGIGNSAVAILDGNFGIGTNGATRKLDIDASSIRLRQPNTPASSSSAGVQGEICWDKNYIYVYVGTKWKRTALQDF